MDGNQIVVTVTTSADKRHPDKPQPAAAGTVELRTDAFFLATGRKPNVEGLGLEAVGIATTKQGIQVDANLRTTAPWAYAIGDIAGGLAFTHVAEAQARLALRNAFFPMSSKWDASFVPWATYTEPELARVGLTEAEAKEAGEIVRVHRIHFSDIDRAITDGQPTGLVKIVANARGKILGAHIAGPGAGEIIHEFVLAMKHGISVGQLSQTIHAYPTLALAVRRAADDFYKAKFEKSKGLVHRLMRLTGVRPQAEPRKGSIVNKS
jgi:pyruvate/2-oxoglutarate dehydrogenase complex dihydrolipoamide dehydrogenase (E3) component